MKKITLLTLVTLSTLSAIAQDPFTFNYQAVVRDADGELVTEQMVKFRMNLIADEPTGTVIYSETHDVTTNEYGLATLAIGNGTSDDEFENISWNGQPFFLNVSIDIEGGTNFHNMGTTQLLSVPYANYAREAQSADSANNALQASTAEHAIRSDSALFADNADWSAEANHAATTDTAMYAINASNKIAFCARNTYSDNIASAGNQTVELDGELFDDGDNFNNTTDQFTAPIDGVYHFLTSVGLYDLEGGERLYLYLNVVGQDSYSYYLASQPYVVISGQFTLSGSVTVKLTASDVVYVRVYCDDAAWSIYGSPGSSVNTFLSGHLVYPL